MQFPSNYLSYCSLQSEAIYNVPKNHTGLVPASSCWSPAVEAPLNSQKAVNIFNNPQHKHISSPQPGLNLFQKLLLRNIHEGKKTLWDTSGMPISSRKNTSPSTSCSPYPALNRCRHLQAWVPLHTLSLFNVHLILDTDLLCLRD